MSIEILWAYDYLRGPYNGLCLMDGNKYWFQRIELDSEEYNIIRITEEILNFIQESHEKRCQQTGHPIYHGAPTIMKTPEWMKSKTTVEALMSKGVTQLDINSIGNFMKVENYFNPNNVQGEIVKIVKEKAFNNFNVPNRIVYKN